MQALPGGRGDQLLPFAVDELCRGMKVELEHTADPCIALEIATDHLAEDPRYYTKLARVHLDGALGVIWPAGFKLPVPTLPMAEVEALLASERSTRTLWIAGAGILAGAALVLFALR